MPEFPKVAFAVNLDAVLRVKPFVSTELTRYYLNGVHIEAHPEAGAFCVATDGHRLGVRFDKSGLCFEPCTVVIPNSIVAPPQKLLARPWLVGILTSATNGHISVVEALPKSDEDCAEAAIERVEEASIRIGRAFIEGKYPDWRRVIPEVSEADTVRGFNADYIRTFTGKTKIRGVALRGKSPSDPHLISIDGDPDFIGVLMPMRVEDPKVPAWLDEAALAAKKAA